MDAIIRIVCVGFILWIGVGFFDSVKLLIESNEGKRYTRFPNKLRISKPKIITKNLVKGLSFFYMINHGPDLCKIEEIIIGVPYYRGKNYLVVLGDGDEKD